MSKLFAVPRFSCCTCALIMVYFSLMTFQLTEIPQGGETEGRSSSRSNRFSRCRINAKFAGGGQIMVSSLPLRS